MKKRLPRKKEEKDGKIELVKVLDEYKLCKRLAQAGLLCR